MHAFYDMFTDRARKSLDRANSLALDKKHILVTNLHVLWGILDEGKNIACKILRDMGINVKELMVEIEKYLDKGKYISHDRAACYAEDVQKCICDAITFGQFNTIGCQNLLQAIMVNKDNQAAKILNKHNVTLELLDAYQGAIVKQVN